LTQFFAAFRSHPLVGIADNHGLAQELDFYGALVRDPRFASEVGNVVVEFGGASHQDTINRYVNGDPVPYTELRKVWFDLVGAVPGTLPLGYLNFYASVRQANLTLSPEHRIHIWLGEPEIDWSKIRNRDQWWALGDQRDRHAAEIIEKNILVPHKKALVIYGGAHFDKTVRPALMEKLQTGGWRPYTLRVLIDKDYPSALFVMTPYAGFKQANCVEEFEQAAKQWPLPGISPVHGFLGNLLKGNPPCYNASPEDFRFPPTITDEEKAEILPTWQDGLTGASGDAILYLGPVSKLTLSPENPDDYLDMEFRDQLARKFKIQTGNDLRPPNMEKHPVTPERWGN
jgi:hypothetical protein